MVFQVNQQTLIEQNASPISHCLWTFNFHFLLIIINYFLCKFYINFLTSHYSDVRQRNNGSLKNEFAGSQSPDKKDIKFGLLSDFYSSNQRFTYSFHLTMSPLAVQLIHFLSTQTYIGDFHPLEQFIACKLKNLRKATKIFPKASIFIKMNISSIF